jgi:PAS domain S-box-containing protein
MSMARTADLAACLTLTQAISRSRSVEQIYAAALDALANGLGVDRSSILLFDADGVMRFKAARGLSDGYRRAVEGHTPWRPDSPDPRPIVIADVEQEPSLAPFLPQIRSEGIAAMTFIPLMNHGRVVGKFMLYYGEPYTVSEAELLLSGVIAAEVAFAVERMRAQDAARQSEERLRFALEAADMGTWDWDFVTERVQWSENIERLHGLPPGTFDGSFASYERKIHADDRARVLASIERAIAHGVPHDVEYRIVAPDGTIRWVEGKGRVEMEHGRPVRMSGVCMNVTRRKQAEAARLDAAREANRLKDEFLATLSHELRTPLNAIIGWVQLLQIGAVSTDRLGEAVAVIDRNARLQARLIEDVLDVSRIITGKLDVERVPVLVSQIVENAVQTVRPASLSKGLTLTCTVEPDLPPVDADPRRLLQVVLNLLGNAMKFTPQGGTIDVRCARDGAWVAISVRDTGAGIAPEFLPYVFERFRQADSRTTRQHGGLGLGLAIAQHLVERHDGRITVESAGTGQGATFHVRLPVPLAPVRDNDIGLIDRQDIPEVDLRGARLLVVDDDKDARDLVRLLLEGRGATVVVADSADSALSHVRAEHFDMLVADIAMPEVDGFTLLSCARDFQPGLAAVALTAYSRPEDRDRVIAAGYQAFHAKPLQSASLLQSIAALLPETAPAARRAAG